MAKISASRALDSRDYFQFVPVGDANSEFEADPQDPTHTAYYYPKGPLVGAPDVIFEGSGFKYDPGTHDLTAGTITSIEQGHFAASGDYVVDYLLSGVSISGAGNGPPQMSTVLRGNDTIVGSKFADKIDGFAGADKLTGGGGADTFYFTTKPSASNRDHITDFKHGTDHISLENDIFRGIEPGNLSRTFHDVTTQSVQADDRILYNHKTGILSYDADGSGAIKAVQIATFDNHASLTVHDFSVLVV